MRVRHPLIDPIRSLGDQFSRRKLIAKSATVIGGGVVYGSASSRLLSAGDDEWESRRASDDLLPLPIPNISPGPNAHVFFPGPVEGTAAPTDPTGAQPNGRDPSTITNFEGFIGEADLKVSGMGTDLDTGAQSPYDFEADMRFMRGKFVGSDQRQHHGTFAFI